MFPYNWENSWCKLLSQSFLFFKVVYFIVDFLLFSTVVEVVERTIMQGWKVKFMMLYLYYFHYYYINDVYRVIFPPLSLQ